MIKGSKLHNIVHKRVVRSIVNIHNNEHFSHLIRESISHVNRIRKKTIKHGSGTVDIEYPKDELR